MTQKEKVMEAQKKSKKLDLRIDAALAAEAKKKARRERRPLSAVVRDLLAAWLGQKA
jgi:hypothetical protein